MAFYEKMRDGSAKKLITKYGSAMTLRRVTSDTYNPSTGMTAAGTSTDYACRGLTQDYTMREIDGTNIRFGDKKVLVSASGLAILPISGDILVSGSNSYSVISVNALAPGEVAVLYTVQARGQS